MIAIFLLAFTLSLFSFGTTPAAAGDVAGVSTHLFLTVLRDYDHDAAFSVTYTDALGTHTKPYHAGMEVTAWSPVTITCMKPGAVCACIQCRVPCRCSRRTFWRHT